MACFYLACNLHRMNVNIGFSTGFAFAWKYGVRLNQQTRGPGRRSRKIAKDQERMTVQVQIVLYLLFNCSSVSYNSYDTVTSLSSLNSNSLVYDTIHSTQVAASRAIKTWSEYLLRPFLDIPFCSDECEHHWN